MFNKYLSEENIKAELNMMMPVQVINIYEECEELKKECKSNIVQSQLNNLQLNCIYVLGMHVIECKEG